MLAVVDAVTFDELATAPTRRASGGPSPGAVLPRHLAATVTQVGFVLQESRSIVLRDWDLDARWEIHLDDTVTDVAVPITTRDTVVVDLTSAGTDSGRTLVGYS